MKKWLLAILILLLFIPFANADEALIIDASNPHAASRGTQLIVITYPIGETAKNVSLRVTYGATGDTVYSKSYGEVAGTFYSDEIYLKNAGQYGIELTAGDETLAFTFNRALLRLNDNTAYSAGIYLVDEKMGTAVDLTRAGTFTYPLAASDKYEIGTVTITVASDSLTVDYTLMNGIDAQITRDALYVFTDPKDLLSLSPSHLSLYRSFALNEPISISAALGGAKYAVIYLPMTLSYDPNGLNTFTLKPDAGQTDILRQMESAGALEPVG